MQTSSLAAPPGRRCRECILSRASRSIYTIANKLSANRKYLKLTNQAVKSHKSAGTLLVAHSTHISGEPTSQALGFIIFLLHSGGSYELVSAQEEARPESK